MFDLLSECLCKAEHAMKVSSSRNLKRTYVTFDCCFNKRKTVRHFCSRATRYATHYKVIFNKSRCEVSLPLIFSKYYTKMQLLKSSIEKFSESGKACKLRYYHKTVFLTEF